MHAEWKKWTAGNARSAASSAKSFDVVSRLQAGVKASKAADADSQNEILVEEPAKFAPNESDSDD